MGVEAGDGFLVSAGCPASQRVPDNLTSSFHLLPEQIIQSDPSSSVDDICNNSNHYTHKHPQVSDDAFT